MTSPWQDHLAASPSSAQASAKLPLKLRIPHVQPLRRRRSWKLRLLGILIAPVLLLAGFFVYLDFQPQRVDALGDYAGRPADTPGVNWLIVGSDSREGLSKQERKKYHTGSDVGKRTDSMMLLHAGNHSSTLISLPRDSYVPIPGHGPNKLNAAFTLGGPKLLSRTVEMRTGVRIDHYVEVGFGGFVGMVDAVGGVRTCIKKPVRDQQAGLDLKAGCQILNGKQALAYTRARHAFAGGDFDRVKNQQKLLAALIRKATAPEVLTNPVQAVPLSVQGTETLTVGSNDHLWNLSDFASALRDITQGRGVTMTVPVAGSGYAPGVGEYVKWDPARAAAIFKALREDQANLPATPRTNPPAPPVATPTPTRRNKATKQPKPTPKPRPSEGGQELIKNGTFTGTIKPWTADSTDPIVVGNQLQVGTVSDESFDLTDDDVDSNIFPLRSGRRYELNFDASADSSGAIGVSVQPFDLNNTALFQQVNLAPSAQHFRFTFTANASSRETIVSFELGGHLDDHEIRIDKSLYGRQAPDPSSKPITTTTGTPFCGRLAPESEAVSRRPGYTHGSQVPIRGCERLWRCAKKLTDRRHSTSRVECDHGVQALDLAPLCVVDDASAVQATPQIRRDRPPGCQHTMVPVNSIKRSTRSR